mgnify:CR=1 FL=1
MNYKPIILVAGEPNSIFLEIFFKALKFKKYKNPLILICSLKVLKLQMKKFNFKKKIKTIDLNHLFKEKLDNTSINLVNVNYESNYIFQKISKKSNKYIKNCFNVAFKILKTGKIKRLINGPISKESFLSGQFLGITEYLSKEFSSKNSAMLIYNKKLSVCPITTHLPLKSVTKKINKKEIINKILLINNFFKRNLNIKAEIAVLGLNPHCESIDKFNEDKMIIKPSIKYLNKIGLNVSGPYPADTIFLKDNRKKFDVIVGMYHDQVLTPMKTLFEYDAINITLGLPIIRVSPDHGPNEKMVGKNKSNPLSLIKAITFLDKN